MNFLNLTNGLEYAPLMKVDGFVRIQSTHCEQKLWSRVIEDLDYSFLLPLVQGVDIHVYDTSHRPDGNPRALFQGLEWIRFVVERRTFERDYVPRVHNQNVVAYFRGESDRLSEYGKAKLKYLRKFARPGVALRLTGHSKHTKRDGDYDYFSALVKELYVPDLDQAPAGTADATGALHQ